MVKRMAQAFVVMIALLFGSAGNATPIATGTWYLGSFTALGDAVTGGSGGGGAIDPGAPAWTFTLTSDHVLTVIDCCQIGDTFEVFDGATSLGITALGSAGGECFTAVACDTNPNAGRGDFLLAAGIYSITMTVTSFVNPGDLFFILREAPGRVPEPHVLALVGVALFGFAAFRRRRRG